MRNSIKQLIDALKERLSGIYQDPSQAEHVAWWLACYVMKQTKIQLLMLDAIELTREQSDILEKVLDKHINECMPLQYILGFVPFLDLIILVKPPILIPRNETEEWCYNLINNLQHLKNKNFKILDLCTGSGCIALSLAKAFPNAYVDAIDISPAALALAQENATYNNITNVNFFQSDLYSSIPSTTRYDVIVANPPYISFAEYQSLDAMVAHWEDSGALMAENNGLSIINKIIDGAAQYLVLHNEMATLGLPQLFIEIGHLQGSVVKHYMEQAGFKNVCIVKDLARKDRVVIGGL